MVPCLTRQPLISSVEGKLNRLFAYGSIYFFLISLSFRIGGTVGAICTCPLELVKTRFQSSQGGALSASPTSRVVPSISSAVTVASTPPQFQTNSLSTAPPSAQTAGVAIATGPTAKCEVTNISQMPGIQSKRIYFTRYKDFILRSKIIRCMLEVGQTEGYRALFKGLLPTLLGVLPSRSVTTILPFVTPSLQFLKSTSKSIVY